jgi:hypothetical protein
MPASTTLNAYREKIYAALRAAGYPVDVWHTEIQAELTANPTAKARPFTQINSPQYGKIKKLRPGFEEFVTHPAHGKPVPRCQAAKKRTGGKVQCGKFAVKGKHLCRTHGGAAGSGKNSAEGRENQRRAVTVHGNETIAKRQARSAASSERRNLMGEANKAGVITGLGARGPYYKPDRRGTPMAHINKPKTNTQAER